MNNVSTFELLQYDLNAPQQSLQPIYRKPLVVEPWFIPLFGYAFLAMGPDCRLYCSNRNHIGRIEYPDLEGDEAGFNPTWRAVPWTFNGGFSTFGGLPDLVNQITFPADQKSCLWPRVEVPPDTTCEGGCVELTSVYYNNVDAWKWTFDGGVPATFSGKTPPCIRYDRAGTYPVKLIATNQAGTDTIVSSVIVRQRPSVSAGPDVHMCKGGSAQLTATGAQTYVWRPASGLSDTTSATPIAKPSRDTMQYIVTGTDAFGCIDVDTVIIIQGTLKAGITEDTAICVGLSVTLQASGGDVFQWWPATALSSTTTASVVATPSTRTKYFVEVRSGTCIDTATVTIDILPKPSLRIDGVTLICAGASTILTATSDQQGNVVWSDAAGILLGTTMTLRVTPSQQTQYTAILTSVDGCSDTQHITVRVEQTIDHRDIDTLVCAGSTLTLDGVDYLVLRDTSWQTVATTPSGCADTSRITLRTETIDLVAEDAAVCIGEPATCRAFTSNPDATITWFDESGTLVHTGATFTTTASTDQTLIVYALSPLGCEAVDTCRIVLTGRQQWALSPGGGSGLPGNTVTTSLMSNITQFPCIVHLEQTAPEAILENVTNGRIIHDGRDGRDVAIELNAATSSLTWQLYLGARQQIPLTGYIELQDTTCLTTIVDPGLLEINGCAIVVRSIQLIGIVRLQMYSLMGDLVCETEASQAQACLDKLRAGLYVVRTYTANTHSDALLLLE